MIDRESLWLERVSGNPRAAIRLFCFHYAGGGTHAFQNWQKHLPPEVAVCPVRLPGRGIRFNEPLFTRLEPLVNALAEEIAWERQKPFAFYGHSMGALISFELARALGRKCGIEPVHLFVSARRAAHLPVQTRTFDLPREQFISCLRTFNGTPAGVLEDAEAMDLFLPVLRADFEMVETYEHQPDKPLCCPITAYGGNEDELVPLESLQGWSQHTSSGCRVRMFPGGHFFIHHEMAYFLRVMRYDMLSILRQELSKPGKAGLSGIRG